MISRSRRQFVRISLLASASVLSLSLAPRQRHYHITRMRQLIRNPESATAIALDTSQPFSNDPAEGAMELVSKLGGKDKIAAQTQIDLVNEIDRLSKIDFATNNYQKIRGWLISRTEISLACFTLIDHSNIHKFS